MKVMGIYISKEKFEYSILQKNSESIYLNEIGMRLNKNYQKISELMEWYDASFNLLLTNDSIDKIGFIIPSTRFQKGSNIHYHSSQNNLIYWYCPCGILFLNAQKKNLEIQEYKNPNKNDKIMAPYIKEKWRENLIIDPDINNDELSKIDDKTIVSGLIPLLKEC